MPTKRTRKTRKRLPEEKITPEVVAAFLKGDGEFLRKAFGMRPWAFTPDDGYLDEPCCCYPPNTAGYNDWQRARRLRLEILQAVQRSPEHRRDRELMREVTETIRQLEEGEESDGGE